jgi:hypothetical protein
MPDSFQNLLERQYAQFGIAGVPLAESVVERFERGISGLDFRHQSQGGEGGAIQSTGAGELMGSLVIKDGICGGTIGNAALRTTQKLKFDKGVLSASNHLSLHSLGRIGVGCPIEEKAIL